MSSPAEVAPVAPPKVKPAATVVYYCNLLFNVVGGGLMLLLPEAAVPGVPDAARPMLRAFGAMQIAWALLLSSLGPVNHAIYCVTMVLHWMQGLALAFEAVVKQSSAEGLPHKRFGTVAVFHAVCGFLMLGVLMTGGISNKHKAKVAKD